jgi:hypothetical protein
MMAWINRSEQHLDRPKAYIDRQEIERAAADPKHSSRNWAKVLLAVLDGNYTEAALK